MDPMIMKALQGAQQGAMPSMGTVTSPEMEAIARRMQEEEMLRRAQQMRPGAAAGGVTQGEMGALARVLKGV